MKIIYLIGLCFVLLLPFKGYAQEELPEGGTPEETEVITLDSAEKQELEDEATDSIENREMEVEENVDPNYFNEYDTIKRLPVNDPYQPFPNLPVRQNNVLRLERYDLNH